MITGSSIKLGSVGTTFGGLTGKSKAHFGHGHARYVTFVEVMEGARLSGRHLGNVVTHNGEKQPEVRRGDVLFNTSSETPEEVALGAHVDFDVPPRVHLNSFCFGYRVAIPGTIDPRFLAYYFRSGEGRRMVASLAQGATRYNISKTKLLEVPIVLPSYKEQRTIAEALTDCDDFIDALERLITKKHDVKQGMMQELLTGRTRLPGFFGEWRLIRLGDVLTVRHGRDQKAVETVGGRFKILATSGQIGATDTPLYTRPSVLIGRKGTIDRPQFEDEPFWSVDTLFYTEIGYDADPKYLFYVFQTVDWRSLNEASGVPSLGAGRVESIVCNLPKIDEQRAIREALDDADAEIDALEQRLESARALKTGMMQELLTGRTRLPVEEDT